MNFDSEDSIEIVHDTIMNEDSTKKIQHTIMENPAKEVQETIVEESIEKFHDPIEIIEDSTEMVRDTNIEDEIRIFIFPNFIRIIILLMFLCFLH